MKRDSNLTLTSNDLAMVMYTTYIVVSHMFIFSVMTENPFSFDSIVYSFGVGIHDRCI